MVVVEAAAAGSAAAQNRTSKLPGKGSADPGSLEGDSQRFQFVDQAPWRPVGSQRGRRMGFESSLKGSGREKEMNSGKMAQTEHKGGPDSNQYLVPY